jgi:hypothetical protein
MHAVTRARFACAATALSATLVAGRASAIPTQACLDASQKGQDARDAGKLLEARRQLATCADPSCPSPVPTYCADWLKDVNRRIPTIAFRVTDATGRDLVDVIAKVDDVVVATKLEGRPIEVDPGSRRITFEHDGARVEQTILVVDSEKARIVTAKLEPEKSATAASVSPATNDGATKPTASGPEPYRPVPVASWIGWGVGAASLVGFGIFGLKAQSDFDDFKSTCGSRCTNEDRDSVKSTVLVADVLLVVGIVAAGVGTYFYLTRGAVERTTSTAHARTTFTARGLQW